MNPPKGISVNSQQVIAILLLLHTTGVKVCACTHAQAHLCLLVWGHVHMCMWQSEIGTSHLTLSPPPILFLRQGLSLSLNLELMAPELQRSALPLPLPSALTWEHGIRTRVFVLVWQTFYQLSHLTRLRRILICNL